MKQDFPNKFGANTSALTAPRAERAILIVGHPSCDYRRVETVLQGVGMAPAKPTRQQRLAPTEISAHLLKRAGVPADFSTKIEQLAPAPLWQILALDLFMGNNDTGFWGWSDSYSVYLLDYWLTTDPAIHFIFVYDSPEQVLIRTSGGKELSHENIARLATEWQHFYGALMHFYHRHRDRCLLVHAEQAYTHPESFDKTLSSHLQRPLERDTSNSAVSMALNYLETSLATGLVQEHYAWRCAYEELQSQADFPLIATKTGDPLAAWNNFSALTAQIRLHADQQAESTKLKNLLSEQESRLAETRGQYANSQAEKSKLESLLSDQRQESKLLLQQLHQVQEELERHQLKNIKPNAPLVALKMHSEQLYGAADHVKRMLSYRLGALMLAHSRSFLGWLSMPAALLREARQFNKEKLSRKGEKRPRLSDYADAHEAEAVKQHLSYRLGATFLANSKSPAAWIKLPWLLSKQIREFKRDRAQK